MADACERRALRNELATRRPSKTTLEYSCSMAFLRNTVISAAEFVKVGYACSSSLLERKSLRSTESALMVGSKLDLSSIVFDSSGHTSPKFSSNLN